MAAGKGGCKGITLNRKTLNRSTSQKVGGVSPPGRLAEAKPAPLVARKRSIRFGRLRLIHWEASVFRALS